MKLEQRGGGAFLFFLLLIICVAGGAKKKQRQREAMEIRAYEQQHEERMRRYERSKPLGQYR